MCEFKKKEEVMGEKEIQLVRVCRTPAETLRTNALKKLINEFSLKTSDLANLCSAFSF